MESVFLTWASGFFICLLLYTWYDEDVRDAVYVCVMWPVVVFFLTLGLLTQGVLRLFGWQAALGNAGPWGIRRPDDGWPGFALRCPWFELLFWKKRSQP